MLAWSFEYVICSDERVVAKIERLREGSRFLYASNDLQKDFTLSVGKNGGRHINIDGIEHYYVGYYNTEGRYEDIVLCFKRAARFFQSITYWVIPYDGIRYHIYEVGKGSQGTFYCIYSNDTLVAMIKKRTVTKNNNTEYEIYSEDYVPKELTVLTALLVDLTRHYPDGKTNTVSKRTMHTYQKELLKKYDEAFIPRIITKENITKGGFHC